jgi:hypothetical protein
MTMKKILSLLMVLASIPAWACEACEKQQPALLKGITHGTGPQSSFDMPIIYASAAVVLFTLVLAVKYLVKPNEDSRDHIKRIILQNPLHDHGR